MIKESESLCGESPVDTGAAAAAGTATVLAGASTAHAVCCSIETPQKKTFLPTNKSLIPPLHPQWKKLDLAKLLSYPTAFVSIRQNNSLYRSEGLYGDEDHRDRGSLEATVRVARAARAAGYRFHWIGYDIFRNKYPKTEMDEAQYNTWTITQRYYTLDIQKAWSSSTVEWQNELPDELKALVQPEDGQYFEIAHQTSFVYTPLHMDLSKRGVKTVIFTGIHLDWSIEGNSRHARDVGFMPIVVGDATACQKQEDESAAFTRINNFFAPVITSDYCVELIGRAVKMRKACVLSEEPDRGLCLKR